MQATIICYVPVKNGISLQDDAWGMVEIANRIHGEHSRIIGIIVHKGMENELLDHLPFHEVYHVRLTMEQWRLAEVHIQAFQQVKETAALSDGTYLFSSSPLYHEVAVRLAVQNEAGIITYAQEIEKSGSVDSLVVKREIYLEKVHEYVTFQGSKLQYITLDTAILYGKQRYGHPSLVRQIPLDDVTASKVKFLSESSMGWQELKITEARCVIGIGRGVSGKDALDCILPLAKQLNAPIGGSKVADELGMIPREKRIGSSGSSIQADIYIAIGISGSSQHLDGIRGVKHVVAINIDPAAPIFQRCDLGIIGDYRDVIPELVKSLQQER